VWAPEADFLEMRKICFCCQELIHDSVFS